MTKRSKGAKSLAVRKRTPAAAVPPSGDPLDTGDGNSSSSPVKGVQKLYWFLTWNNYTEKNLNDLLKFFRAKAEYFVVQREKGELNGTPHLQGCCKLKTKMRWSEFHLEDDVPPGERKARWFESRNKPACIEYCQKSRTSEGECWKEGKFPKKKVEVKILDDSQLYPYQRSIRDACLPEPDERTINWVYDPIGGIGKTKLIKFMITKYNVIAATLTALKDVACIIAECMENDNKNGGERDFNDNLIILLNLPRDCDLVSYNCLEQLKDGLITSSKYHSSTLVLNCPHIWVFSNHLPDSTKLTKDRLKIWQVKEMILMPYIDPVKNDLKDCKDGINYHERRLPKNSQTKTQNRN